MNIIKKNNVVVIGKGQQAMVFAHGFGCDQNMWRHIVPAFEHDYKIVLFDHLGSGNSDISAYQPTQYANLNGYANDLVDICHFLNLKNSIFVGHSVSCMIGALACIKSPEIFSSLIMIGPSPRYINDERYFGGFEPEDIEELMDSLASNYLGWSSTMAPLIMGNPDQAHLTEELTNKFCQMSPDIAEQFAKATFYADNRADLVKLHVPCLIMQCSDDIIAPIQVGEYVHEKIPNSELVYLKASGHCPNLSAPQETIKEIQKFLKKL